MIKYRVWCKNKQEWETDEIAILPNGNILHMDKGINKEFPCYIKKENHNIEMFAGIYDLESRAQKQEIYVNDIVSLHQFLFDGDEVECETIGIIGNIGTCFTLAEISSKYIEELTGYSKGECELPIMDFYPIDHIHGLHELSFKLLGNIHENPELLEA